jgi:hypothetical protein
MRRSRIDVGPAPSAHGPSGSSLSSIARASQRRTLERHGCAARTRRFRAQVESPYNDAPATMSLRHGS